MTLLTTYLMTSMWLAPRRIPRGRRNGWRPSGNLCRKSPVSVSKWWGVIPTIARNSGDEGVHVVQIKKMGINGVLPVPPPFIIIAFGWRRVNWICLWAPQDAPLELTRWACCYEEWPPLPKQGPCQPRSKGRCWALKSSAGVILTFKKEETVKLLWVNCRLDLTLGYCTFKIGCNTYMLYICYITHICYRI